MKSKHNEPSQETLRQLLDYDPATGVLVWKHKVGDSKSIRTWNTINAGKLAGGVHGLTGYHLTRFNGVRYRSHRLIWAHVYGLPVPEQIDHVNGARADNRLENLREATPMQNSQSKKTHANNFLGVKGVSQRGNKYIARITVQKETICLGTFTSAEAASSAYIAAAHKYHGEFYRPESAVVDLVSNG